MDLFRLSPCWVSVVLWIHKLSDSLDFRFRLARFSKRKKGRKRIMACIYGNFKHLPLLLIGIFSVPYGILPLLKETFIWCLRRITIRYKTRFSSLGIFHRFLITSLFFNELIEYCYELKIIIYLTNTTNTTVLLPSINLNLHKLDIAGKPQYSFM